MSLLVLIDWIEPVPSERLQNGRSSSRFRLRSDFLAKANAEAEIEWG
jgi:hypothetical protein